MPKKNLSPTISPGTKQFLNRTIEEINSAYLPKDFPYLVTAVALRSEVSHENSKKLITCIEFAKKLWTVEEKPETRRTYRSICNHITAFLTANELLDIRIYQFTRRQAADCMDWLLIERNLANTTYNNYLEQLIRMFNLFRDKEYTTVNPFEFVGRKKEVDTERRAFTEEERKVIMKAAYETDWWLFIAILFQYAVLIRKEEFRRIRFSQINLEKSLIYLKKGATKNGKADTVTIPSVMLKYLRDTRFSKHPTNYLIFGEKCLPHPTKAVGKNTIAVRFEKLIKKLKIDGTLGDTTNLSFYSLKYSGNTQFAKTVKLNTLRKHNRHSSTDQTIKYFRDDEFDPEIFNLNIELF